MRALLKIIPREKVHFVGIGGVGMSALARILLAQGFSVSGSDVKQTDITRRLARLGAKIYLTHQAENIKDVDIVVYSSCITKLNPEIIAARRKNIRLIRRAFLLAKLMDEKIGIAVAGAHGKTTTTALISLLLKNCGLDPTFAIGADVCELGGNAEHGEGKYFVAEADESDGSFLYLHPKYAIVTNIDKEHLDYYKSLNQIVKTHGQFINNIRKDGVLFCYGEDKNIHRALAGFKKRYITYGLKNYCHIYAERISCQGFISKFQCFYEKKFVDSFTLQIPGVHNILNALACIGLVLELGLDRQVLKKTLTDFRGAQRRFQVKTDQQGIMIIEDYAHHPTEIMATLKAARTWKRKRLIGVFQPHRYSRTKFLKEEFGRCFKLADHLVITDIYPAFESPIKGVGAKIIYDQIKKSGHRNVCLLPKDKINNHLLGIMRRGDMLMLLGAGDIGNLADELVKKLAARKDGHNVESKKLY